MHTQLAFHECSKKEIQNRALDDWSDGVLHESTIALNVALATIAKEALQLPKANNRPSEDVSDRCTNLDVQPLTLEDGAT